jgi:hypothetical protein
VRGVLKGRYAEVAERNAEDAERSWNQGMTRRWRWRRAKWACLLVGLAMATAWVISGWWQFEWSRDTPRYNFSVSLAGGQAGFAFVEYPSPPDFPPADGLAIGHFQNNNMPTPAWYPDVGLTVRRLGGALFAGGGIDLMAVALPFLLLGGVWLWRDLRRRPGRCPRCDYDLSGNSTGICPECGAKQKAERDRGGRGTDELVSDRRTT